MQSNKDLVERIITEVVNGGDLAAVNELFDAGYVLHKPGFSGPLGAEAFRMYVREWRRAAPDYEVRILELVGDGDLVACLVELSGTHDGTLLGTPASGRRFSLTGTELHRVAGGRLVASWLVDDVPRILIDTGVLAPTGAGAGRWT